MWLRVVILSSALILQGRWCLYESDFNYPTYVLPYEKRKDVYTNQHVSFGRFEMLKGFPTNPKFDELQKKVTMKEFRQSLQCVPHENKYERSGSLHFMKLIPPTREILEKIAAWCETECRPWSQCSEIALDYKKGNFNPSIERIERMSSGAQYQIKLLRIMSRKLYLDWPWGRDRIRLPYGSITNQILYLTSVLTDLPDLFFFIGVERPWAPSQFPVPSFSNSPSFLSSDLPFPWYAPLTIQIETYRRMSETKNFSLASFLSASRYGPDIPWELKLNKCAYYGTLTENRQIFFHIAATRPDLIDLGWTMDYLGTHDWNPLSDNPHRVNSDTLPLYHNVSESHARIGVGYTSNLLSSRLKEGVNFVKRFKYLVVLTGLNGEALSGSLNNLLTQSGAVILLQRSPFIYHFSSHLRPWVHYVPLSHTADDVIEKIEWLQSHPHLAKRIAENGRKFGQSYLRLEDSFCYLLNIFESIAKRVNQTTAMKPFDPIEITAQHDRW
jgi:hypothetical protein